MEYEVGKILENIQQQLESIWQVLEDKKIFTRPKNDKEEP